MNEKIWTHSADSHFLEPKDLWHQMMPKAMADRMPRREQLSDTEERITVDGKSFDRKIPKIMLAKGETGETIAELSHRPPGSRDLAARLVDLDEEGVWAEVMYQSIGLWCGLIDDKALIAAAAAAENEWLATEVQGFAPDRLVPAALMPLVDVDDAVAEVHHCADLGLKLISLTTGHAPGNRRLQPRVVGALVGRRRGDRHGRRVSTSAPTEATRRRRIAARVARCSTMCTPASAG